GSREIGERDVTEIESLKERIQQLERALHDRDLLVEKLHGEMDGIGRLRRTLEETVDLFRHMSHKDTDAVAELQKLMPKSIETNQGAAERNISILQEMMYRSSEAVDRSAQNNLKMIDRIISNNAEAYQALIREFHSGLQDLMRSLNDSDPRRSSAVRQEALT